MKNLFDGELKKRKIALAAALVGALVLPLCSCGMGGIEGKALKYLASQYSGEFTITDSERIANQTGPLPVFTPTYHWKLTAESSRFPGETFSIYYRQNEDRSWYWSDNYYSVLFRDEAETTCKELVEAFWGANCILESVFGISPWPDGADENSTIKEWMEAGGKISRLEIWLCDFLPDDESCATFSETLIAKLPNISCVGFHGLTAEGYQAAIEGKQDYVSLWNEHPDWRIGQAFYYSDDGKVTH